MIGALGKNPATPDLKAAPRRKPAGKLRSKAGDGIW
jgi:hypothetical protein